MEISKIHTFITKDGVYTPIPMMSYKIYYPLYLIFTDDEQTLLEYYDASFTELVGVSEQIEFKLRDDFIYRPKIYLTNDYKPRSTVRMIYNQFLVFEANLPVVYPESDIRRFDDNYPPEGIPVSFDDMIWITASSNINAFVLDVQRFLVLLQIAKPGILAAYNAESTIEDKYYSEHFPIENFIYVHRISPVQNLSWPILKDLKILDVYHWFKNHKLSFNKISATKTDLALNAYTYLLHDSNIVAYNLLWAMIGVEAIYCSSRSEVADQISKKAQVFLGENPNLPKILKNLYDYRSRFVHGDLHIPSLYFRTHDGDKHLEKYEEDLEKYVNLAIVVLLATFQEMVTRDIREINFEYKVK